MRGQVGGGNRIPPILQVGHCSVGGILFFGTMSNPTPLRQVARLEEIHQPGEWCFAIGKGGKKKVLLGCPYCGKVMACPHEVLCESPLTLGRSIVGPVSGDQIIHKCGHHFFIHSGFVVET
jgi:hypothetical protein